MDPTCEHGKAPDKCPDCRLAKQRDRDARKLEEKKRLDAIATTPPPRPLPAPAPIKVHVDVVEARDKSLLAAIDRSGGLVRVKDLRLPAGDPAALDELQAAQAIKDALTRLKFKGVLARTGDTWSRVGIGMTADV